MKLDIAKGVHEALKTAWCVMGALTEWDECPHHRRQLQGAEYFLQMATERIGEIVMHLEQQSSLKSGDIPITSRNKVKTTVKRLTRHRGGV